LPVICCGCESLSLSGCELEDFDLLFCWVCQCSTERQKVPHFSVLTERHLSNGSLHRKARFAWGKLSGGCYKQTWITRGGYQQPQPQGGYQGGYQQPQPQGTGWSEGLWGYSQVMVCKAQVI